MKRIAFAAAILAGLVLATQPAMAEPITTKAQFLEQIAGKKLVQNRNWVILSADGTVRGEGPANGPITGKWNWEDTYYCRDVTVDGTAFPRDCQSVTRAGNTVSFIHNRGKGITIAWEIE